MQYTTDEPDVNPAMTQLTRLSPSALMRRRHSAAHKAQWATERGLWTVARDAMLRLDAADAEQARRDALEGGLK